VNKKDVIIEYFRASGPGGQRRNKKDTAVRITHTPTGLSAVATESRYRSHNLKTAFVRLEDKIEAKRKRQKPRLPTTIPRRATERRLRGKRLRAQKKALRTKVNPTGYNA
jgi:protein subunit release factor B